MSKSNLYTKGGEYRLPDGREYVGSYHIHPNKGPMVGALHSTKPHSFLFPYLNRIQSFEFDYSDLPPTSEKRSFSIVGDNGSEFKLEIKDNTTGKYYNFITNVFQTNQYSLEEKITNNRYDGTIKFPAITGADDQYDIYLYAVPGTEHAPYEEVRFADGSIDLNNSKGSNSLMMQKVVYQYENIALRFQGFSPNSTVSGTMATNVISISRSKNKSKTDFSFTCTAATTAAYRVLRQPTADDILAFIEPVVGSAPEILPGENEYPTITETAQIQTGGTTSSATIILRTPMPDINVGDKWHPESINIPVDEQFVQSVTTDGYGNVTQFVTNTAFTYPGATNLTFRARKNFRWPIDNYINVIDSGMIVFSSANITAGTTVSSYSDVETLNSGTVKQKTLIKNFAKATNTKGQKPTIVKSLITNQAGNIIFDKQQVIALAGDTLKIGGYGENEILRLYGWDVKFSNLAITLTPPTTTTTEASAGGSSADIAVTSKEGVINNVSRVGGIGINPALQNPLITSGGGATGGGDWTMDAVQTLENGITLTVENTGRIATISGSVEVIKAGNSNLTLFFDIEKLLSNSA